MKDFFGRAAQLVKNDTVKPGPTEYPPLLPTLQTYVGMVLDSGKPISRSTPANIEKPDDINEQTKLLHSRIRSGDSKTRKLLHWRMRCNLEACVESVTKADLLEYLRCGKRVDTEQAVAMVIAYLRNATDSEDFEVIEDDCLEGEANTALDELLNDSGTTSMLSDSCMWRTAQDRQMLEDSREVAYQKNWSNIVSLIQKATGAVLERNNQAQIIEHLQTIRRQRKKLEHIQHLTFPDELLPADLPNADQWSWKNNYKHGIQTEIPIANPQIITKHLFRHLQNFICRLGGPTDKTSIYVLEAETFMKTSGQLSPARLEVLRASHDPFAIAYSFITAQRHNQLKVVSDPRWTRFLVKGEGAMVLQNRPDVLTSFEDILVRHATDLVALSAVSCPKGVRDNFSTKDDILTRTRKVCEFMERYVRDFGDGKMENLVYKRDVHGGSGRGPVDVYNALCDELRDCRARAKAKDVDLRIGPVHKFLAKDIMAWNDAWKDDAFAGGKVPGWVEYLARVRLQDLQVS